MLRISSSITLLLKIFIPTFWIVFFGSFTLAILFLEPTDDAFLGQPGFKIGFSIFYLAGIAVLALSLFRLQRVEIDSNYLYVTNYFKTYRYPHDSMEKISELELIIFKLGIIYLRETGSLGRKIYFVQSRQKFEDYIKSSQHFSEKLIKNKNDRV